MPLPVCWAVTEQLPAPVMVIELTFWLAMQQAPLIPVSTREAGAADADTLKVPPAENDGVGAAPKLTVCDSLAMEILNAWVTPAPIRLLARIDPV